MVIAVIHIFKKETTFSHELIYIQIHNNIGSIRNIAVKNGATQIILGTIFETDCKKGLKGKGIGFVEAICKACPLPVYAIGGINLERLPQVRKAGAAGGCMMSGFMQLVKN